MHKNIFNSIIQFVRLLSFFLQTTFRILTSMRGEIKYLFFKRPHLLRGNFIKNKTKNK